MEENNGISLSKIFATIGVHKWIVLIIAAVITLAGTLAIQFGYNKTNAKYVTEFTLILPGEYTGTTVYTYPDGTTFNYASMTSYESLNSIKQSDEMFSSIDVDRMVAKDDMSIERAVETTDATTEIIFKISTASKYFSNENLAKEFLKRVATAPADYLKIMHLNCDVFIELSKQSEDYVEQIDLLGSQVDYLLDEYKNLIESYGGNFVIDGRTLSSYYNEVLAYDSRNTLNILSTKVKDEKILKTEFSRTMYTLNLSALKRELQVAQSTLENLKNSSSSGSTTVLGEVSVIKTQSDYVENLKLQIADAEKFSTEGVVDENGTFEKDYLASEYVSVSNFTQTFSTVTTAVYTKTSTVSFKKVSIVTLEGGWSMIVSLIVSLFVGLLVAFVVGYIMGKYIPKKKQAAVSENPTVYVPNPDESDSQ